ncbi:DNA repair protein rad52 [Tulasnella sp. JGI-2019a]|nr:DNA repair protein rad52 [Tulasnella sp. JGI-2019a]KAG9009762.1 DNA repair protein rad52 [Tulasnella sp. JGI-2019a]
MHGNFSGGFGAASSSTPNSFFSAVGGIGNSSYGGGGGGDLSFQDISLATAQHIATLQAKLDKKLGPEYISTRPGGGGMKLTYIEGWKAINLANEVFGFNGWSSSIQSLTVDFIDYNEQTQRYNVGVTAIVRITLRDGVYHEDLGYGVLENTKQKGPALDKCKKEAVTDAIKRTLRNFGNVLGNCLYDKSYVAEVSKIKVPPPKFDRPGLHRRPEFEERPPAAASALNITVNTSVATNHQTTSSEVLKPLLNVPSHVLPRQPRSPVTAAVPLPQQTGRSIPLPSPSNAISNAPEGRGSNSTSSARPQQKPVHGPAPAPVLPKHAQAMMAPPTLIIHEQSRVPDPSSTQDYFGEDGLDTTAFAELEMIAHDAATAEEYEYVAAEGVDGGPINFDEGLGGSTSSEDAMIIEQPSGDSDKPSRSASTFKRSLSTREVVRLAMEKNAAEATSRANTGENAVQPLLPRQQQSMSPPVSTCSPLQHVPQQQKSAQGSNPISTRTPTPTTVPVPAAPRAVAVGGFHFPDGVDLAAPQHLRTANPPTNGGGVGSAGVKRSADGTTRQIPSVVGGGSGGSGYSRPNSNGPGEAKRVKR